MGRRRKKQGSFPTMSLSLQAFCCIPEVCWEILALSLLPCVRVHVCIQKPNVFSSSAFTRQLWFVCHYSEGLGQVHLASLSSMFFPSSETRPSHQPQLPTGLPGWLIEETWRVLSVLLGVNKVEWAKIPVSRNPWLRMACTSQLPGKHLGHSGLCSLHLTHLRGSTDAACRVCIRREAGGKATEPKAGVECHREVWLRLSYQTVWRWK